MPPGKQSHIVHIQFGSPHTPFFTSFFAATMALRHSQTGQVHPGVPHAAALVSPSSHLHTSQLQPLPLPSLFSSASFGSFDLDASDSQWHSVQSHVSSFFCTLGSAQSTHAQVGSQSQAASSSVSLGSHMLSGEQLQSSQMQGGFSSEDGAHLQVSHVHFSFFLARSVQSSQEHMLQVHPIVFLML